MVPGFKTLRTSLRASVGDIVFGMEDGTVFIFGLVFGMALSAPDSQAVLLAGATGAAAAAVSMMAGSYLDAAAARATAETIGAAEMGRAYDVLSEVALAGLVDAALARFARIDILVNIAGRRHSPAS